MAIEYITQGSAGTFGGGGWGGSIYNPIDSASTAYAHKTEVDTLKNTVNQLTQKLTILNDEAQNIKKDFSGLDKRTENVNTIVMAVTIGISIIFVLTSVAIGLDYFRNNQERYEKFLDKMDEYYTKTETVSKIEDLKKCLKAGGWNSCLQ
jgi:hypothetical protein